MIRSLILTFLTISVLACQNNGKDTTGTENQSLSVDAFEQKLANLPGTQLIDVRTPEEFAGGHLSNALNININSSDFITQLNQLDKNKPILIYCLSGVRSNRALRQLQQMGFKEVYHLEGGLMRWRQAGKPLSEVSAPGKGMSATDFEKIIVTNQYVLVDYTAAWCAPCKRMAPYLDAFATENKAKLALVKIDADQHKDFLIGKGIEVIPFLELYQDGKLIWKQEGFLDEPTFRKEVRL